MRLIARSLGAAAIMAFGFVSTGLAAAELENNAPIAPREFALPSGDDVDFELRMLSWSGPASEPSIVTRELSIRPAVAPAGRLRVSSWFGWRVDPYNGVRRRHDGIDLPGVPGAPVTATAAGVVRIAGWVSGYGNLVEIEHPNGLRTRYGHLAGTEVVPGQRVGRGQVIGELGSTGRSTGPHVHYEIRMNGVPVNPAGFLAPSAGPPSPFYETIWAVDIAPKPHWTGWVDSNKGGVALPQAVIR